MTTLYYVEFEGASNNQVRRSLEQVPGVTVIRDSQPGIMLVRGPSQRAKKVADSLVEVIWAVNQGLYALCREASALDIERHY